MRRFRISLALPAAMALLAAGCESSTLQPGELIGEYALRSLNGTAPPVAAFSTAELTIHILADTLRLEENGRGSNVSLQRTDWVDPARPDQESRFTIPFTYRIRGGRFEVTYDCPAFPVAGVPEHHDPAAQVEPTTCIPGPHFIGERQGAELVLRDQITLRRYQRLEP